MSAALTFIVPLAMLAVVIALGLGLYNMTRGGSPNTSQKLMRARVILQAIAILVMLVALAIKMK